LLHVEFSKMMPAIMNESDNTEQALQKAVQLHGAGKLQEAERLYREVLSQDPEQPDALHYLGVIAMQAGRFDAAAELITRALQQQPQNHFAMANLGNALLQAGNPAEAIDRYRAALTIEPSMFDARRNLASALMAQNEANEALREIKQAAAMAPRSLEVQVTLGNILQETGFIDEAIACFDGILKVRSDLAPIHVNLGSSLRQAGRSDEAIASFEKAIALAPDHAEAHLNLGIVYQDLGEKEKAATALRRALSIDSSNTKAWFALADLSKHSLSESDVAAIAVALDSPELGDDQRTNLEFALGKFHEDSNEHAKAMPHYLAGNKLKRASLVYSIDEDRNVFENLKAVFDDAFFERWSGVGSDSSAPIFIVGMPRSGTSLVEQVLASHPQVYGGGELMELLRAVSSRFALVDGVDYSAGIAKASAGDFEGIAEHYLQAITGLKGDASHVTDKLPTNFINVGLISIVFPKATVIHCIRDPRDTCFSIFKHLFKARGHNYAYDLEELGTYHNLYTDMMAHWCAVAPIDIHELRYEEMIGSQEETTRALLEACNLPWDPACLEFHKTVRPVSTISADQVRRPIYSSSIGLWQQHEDALAPLLRVLKR
jgi:tetratricopeptide (TPR) repeat protein